MSGKMWTDLTDFGARSIPTNAQPQGVATAKAGATSISLSGGNTSWAPFANGDSARIDGAGPACALALPTGIKVIPSMNAGGTPVAPTNPGSTQYAYRVIACDKFGGCSAASALSTTFVGAATLGRVTSSIDSISLLNNVLTIKTKAPHGFVPGAMAFIQFFSTKTALFEGWFIVSSVPDTSSICCNVSFDSRNPGTPTLDANGGVLVGYNCNRLTWPKVPGAWKYYIYGRNSSQLLIGVVVGGDVEGPSTIIFNDYGSPMHDGQLYASYVPRVAPEKPTNQYLVVQLVSGAGVSTTVGISTPILNDVTNANILMGNDAAFLAAYKAAGASTLFIPPGSFPLAGYVKLKTAVGPRILQSGNLVVSDTLEIGDPVVWKGWSNNSQGGAFNLSGGGIISGQHGAHPVVYQNNGRRFEDVAFTDTAPNGGLLIYYGLDGYCLSYDYCYFTWGDGSSPNYIGKGGLVRSGGFYYRFNGCSFGGPQVPTNTEESIGHSFIPGFSFVPRGDGTPTGNISAEHCWFFGRSGFENYNNSGLGVGMFRAVDISTQNLHFPAFVFSTYPAVNQPGNDGVYIESAQMADFPTALLANFMLGSVPMRATFVNPSGVPQGGHSFFTGNPISTMSIGNGNLSTNNGGRIAASGVDGSVVAIGGALFGVMMDIPKAPLSAIASAGTKGPTPGAHTYQLSGVDENLKQTMPGPAISVVVVAGMQTITLALPTTPPKGAIGYGVFRDGLFLMGWNGTCQPAPLSIKLPATTFVDNYPYACNQSPNNRNEAFSANLK